MEIFLIILRIVLLVFAVLNTLTFFQLLSHSNAFLIANRDINFSAWLARLPALLWGALYATYLIEPYIL